MRLLLVWIHKKINMLLVHAVSVSGYKKKKTRDSALFRVSRHDRVLVNSDRS
ncbi:hypothetical protein Hdeb2414_s0004g00137211 [Helianthus debilis subsp. tardiflorus]